jgi:hypothetical protein
METSNGAAFTRFVVKMAAALAAGSETIKERSLIAFFRMPAYVAAKVNPFGVCRVSLLTIVF